MIIIACSTFNDLNSYKRHLSSMPNDPAVVHTTVDGKYKEFDYPCGLSNDGTRELALLEGSVLISAPNLTQIQKRQIYFNITTKDDILIPIDSDEYIVGDWLEFTKELNKYKKLVVDETPFVVCINTYNTIHHKYDPRPRIFFNPHNIVTGPRHFEFTNRITKKSIISRNMPLVKSIKLEHNYNHRYESYNELRQQYYDNTKMYR